MSSHIACMRCKRLKKKCDKQIPSCFSCQKIRQKCQYPKTDRRKPATHAYIESLQDRIKSLEASLNYYATQNSREDRLKQDQSYSELNSLNKIGLSNLQDCRGRTPTPATFPGSPQAFLTPNVYSSTPSKYMVNFSILDALEPTQESEGKQSSSSFEWSNNQRLFLPKWQLNISNTGKISFQGPTSLRFISISDVNNKKPLRKADTLELFDEFHQEIFTCFFNLMNNSIPLIDKQLFLSSLNEAMEGDELGEYSPMTLINAIMSVYFLYRGIKEDAVKFKKLAVKQLEDEVENNPNVTVVQTLILLSQISMTEGNEFQGSGFIARATAVSYHLGLHVKSKKLVEEGKMTVEEGRLRDNVFWCCFLTDRVRCIILGMHPYLNCSDISVDLPSKENIPNGNDDFQEYETFKESVLFHDLEVEMSKSCFSSDLAFGLIDKSSIVISIEQKLVVSKALTTINNWKRKMSSQARFFNNRSINAAQLEISILTVKVLFNKTLLTGMVEDENYELITESDSDATSSICLNAAKRVIKLCSEYKLNDSLFLYKFIYSLFLSSVIVLFNMTSPKKLVKKHSRTFFLKAFELLRTYGNFAPVVNTYLDHLNKFRKTWLEDDDELRELFELESQKGIDFNVFDDSNTITLN